MRYLSIVLFALFFSNIGFSQGEEESNKNAIYGSIGLVFISGNYERMINESETKFFKSTWAKLSFGKWAGWGNGGYFYEGGLTALTGAREHHMEFHGGITSIFDEERYDIGVSNSKHFSEPKPSKSEYRKLHPSGAIGYRFQKANGNFIFRTGVGYPEVFYISLGFSF